VRGCGLHGEKLAHVRFVFATEECFFLGYFPFNVKLLQRVVHGDHTNVFTGLHDAWEHVGFTFSNAVSNSGGVDEKLEGELSTRAVDVGDELLGNDASE